HRQVEIILVRIAGSRTGSIRPGDRDPEWPRWIANGSVECAGLAAGREHVRRNLVTNYSRHTIEGCAEIDFAHALARRPKVVARAASGQIAGGVDQPRLGHRGARGCAHRVEEKLTNE